MDNAAKIKQGLKDLHDQGHYTASAFIYGKCIGVNGIDTIDVDVDDITYHDVQLQAITEGAGQSLIVVPAKGSMVLIGNAENGTGYILIKADKADRILVKQTDGMFIDVLKNVIKLNGDNKGGLLIESKLVDELKKVNNILQPIMVLLSGATIPEPGNGAPSALQAAMSAAIAGKQLPQYLEITNDKVKHGN
jgi:hypothetical protein